MGTWASATPSVPGTVSAGGTALTATGNAVAGSDTVSARPRRSARLSVTTVVLESIAVSPGDPVLPWRSGAVHRRGHLPTARRDITSSVTWASARLRWPRSTAPGCLGPGRGAGAITASLGGVTSPADIFNVVPAFVVTTPATAAPARSARRSSIPTPRPGDQHHRLRHLRPACRRCSALAPARDHQSRPDRRLFAAGLRRHATDRAERQPGRRRRRPDHHRLGRHRPRPGHQQFQPGRRHPPHGHRRHGRLDLWQFPGDRSDRHAGRAQRLRRRNRRGGQRQPHRNQRRRRQRRGRAEPDLRQPVRWRLDQRPGHGWQRGRGQLHRHECHRGCRPGQRDRFLLLRQRLSRAES